MRRILGFTLIELMIAVAVVGILTVVAYPSYESYARRAIRSQGQQFLMDIAQRQEQYFLDQRQYATALGTGAGQINVAVSTPVADNYQAAVFTIDNAATPPTWRITLAPKDPGKMAVDGALVINNLQQHWRQKDGNATYDQGVDCLWEDTRCNPS